MLKIALRYFIGGIILALIAGGCSSSSYQSRYDKKTPPQEKPAKKVRFSSENDYATEKKEDTAVKHYSDPAEGKSEFDEPPVDDYKIDVKSFAKKFGHIKEMSAALTPREKLLFEVIKYVETPYQYGGNSLNGIDCSAFTQNAFAHALNVKLPRTAKEQFRMGTDVPDVESLKFGDLIFFNTTARSYPGHVGIYLGNYLFVHASQSQGVKISSLKSNYYRTRFIEGRRIYKF